MDIYCWTGVAVLLIIFAIALFWLWSRGNTHSDSIKWLEQEKKSVDLSIVAAKDEAIGVAKIAVAEAKAAKVEFNLHRTGVYEPKVKVLEEAITVVDEAVGILERRFDESEELVDCVRKDAEELWVKANDAERRLDTHEKRLNDQMTHVTGMEKKVAVLSAKVEGQDAASAISLHAIETLGQVYLALLAQGTFITVDASTPAPKRAARKGKR